jgi:hypothetical protein
MQKIGPTVFGNLDYKLRVEESFDDQLVEDIAKSLEPRFKIKSSAMDAAAFADIEGGIENKREVKRRILALPRRPDVDAYVIVLPQSVRILGTTWNGLSVSRFGALLGDGQTSVSAFYGIGVYNASTGERIDYGTARYPSTATLTGHEPPTEICANSMWADSSDQLAVEQRDRIRQELASLISRSVAFTLASANLIDKAEAGEATAKFSLPKEPSCHPGP